jgi:hypothetical protein
MIDEWAREFGVSVAAVAELKRRMGIDTAPQTHELGTGEPAGSEGRQQALVRLEAAKKGVRLFRNNVGAIKDERGVPVRFGLANDSKALNDVLKSADLIGWTPTLIQPHHVGMMFALFTSVEMKHEGWTYKGDAHERAQLAWLNLVIAGGGRALFATGPDFL